MTKLLPLLFLITLSARGQNENDILQAKEKKNGVYMSFMEFRTNSPSITGTLKITNHRIKIKNDQTGKYENLKESFWGACLNDSIYVHLKEIETTQSPHIYPLDFLGRYCYFSDYGSYKMYQEPMPGPASKYKYEYVVNINNGTIYKMDKKLMRQILSKDLDLLEQFENEIEKGQAFKKYIELYNSRHPEDIKPMDSLQQN